MRRAWPRYPWATAVPERHTQRHSAAGAEGAGEPGGMAAVSVGGAGPGHHTQRHSAAGAEGMAAVSVGGGRAWPGFEPTRRAEGSQRGRRAGGPPPTDTYSDPARRRPGTPAVPPGHAKGAGTEVPAPHSATTSSRLRLNQAQPWRRRRIHRRRPPAAAAPRPAVPTRPSKPVRARRCARLVLGFVAGASGAT